MRARREGHLIAPGARRSGISDRRSRRTASTRRVLLLAGRSLFSEKGLYESKVEEITEKADIGKGTLYRYFASKEDLVLAVVEAGFDDLRRRVKVGLAPRERLEARVEAIARAHVEFFAENADLMKIFHQVRGVLKFARPEWRPLRASLESHLEFLEEELRQARGAERLGRRQLQDLAILIFGSISGTLSIRLATDPGAGIGVGASGIVTALGAMCEGLVARPNARPAPRVTRRPADRTR